MAEGGRFTEDDYELAGDGILRDDDDDQKANTTQPFQQVQNVRPGASSTPYHGGEQHEMPTMQHKQSGLPSYDETTPLITDEEIQKKLDILRYDRDTGLLDTTKMADTSVNPLSEEDKQLQIN